MRLENGKYVLLSRHLERLQASATHFAFPLSLTKVRRNLVRYAKLFPRETRRVRLLVFRSGGLSIESEPLGALPDQPLPVALTANPICRHHPFLSHKTTHRQMYDSRRALFPAAFDVLLMNEADELTEFTTGNLVMALDGRLWTPPLSAGLLPGTFRAHLLARGKIRERLLTKDDLHRSARLWYINSVRGWIAVRLQDEAEQVN